MRKRKFSYTKFKDCNCFSCLKVWKTVNINFLTLVVRLASTQMQTKTVVLLLFTEKKVILIGNSILSLVLFCFDSHRQ